MADALYTCLDRPGFRKLGEIHTRARLKEPAEMGGTRKAQIGGDFLGALVRVIKIPFCLQNDPPLD